ncbi:MAG: choice-of-anchor J domain-containing protein [Cytophagales bacterium]|nr:choice-of-anchor J domain-containing protein [Cytophagales bacterium]
MRNCLSRANKHLFTGIFALFFFLLCQKSEGQSRCAVSHDSYHENPEQFENWIHELRKVPPAHRTENTATRIPVVFHIIHQGEPLGEGSNLPLERIEQQMTTLNQDFRRLNPDTLATPAAFLPVAVDTQIEFVLARQDPDGLPTNGITRTRASLSTYRFQDDDILKSEAYWPAEDYLNIYVSNLDGFLGWATFPFSDLVGIDEINNNRLTDGVAVDFEYVGYNPEAREFESLGRTLTHEIGHFFGLKHVWGDGGCSEDDFVQDTPLSSTSYQGQCPTDEVESCSSIDMYSNFLNYTDDACMNLFTFGQRGRMALVLQNSIRRSSLRDSRALGTPVMQANDLGITNVENPEDLFCDTSFSPQVGIRNFGTNTVTNVEISMLIDNVTLHTLNQELELNTGATTTLTFPSVNFETSANQDLTFQVVSINGVTDENSSNNLLEITVPPATRVPLPYLEDFESINTLITRTEISISDHWERATAPYLTSTDVAGQLNFHGSQRRLGEFHYLLLPNLDLTDVNSASLSFRYAYARLGLSDSKDGLLLMASRDCGVTFDQVLFSSYGEELVTIDRTITSAFTPTGPDDWQEVELNITSILDPNLRLAFVGQNGSNNNIYIDDIQIIETELQAYDIGITNVTQLPVVTCTNFISPRITVENFGFETINNYNLQYELAATSGQSSVSTELVSGGVEANSIAVSNLEDGTYTVTLSSNAPNQETDQDRSNNTYTRNFVINSESVTLPFRETFDQPDQWVTVNPTGNAIWTQQDQSVQAAAFATGDLGSAHWLVSPVLNTGSLTEGTLRFRMAHAQTGVANDRLQVLLSVNCGQSYDQIIFDKSGEALSTTTATTAFTPTEEDWREESIDISQYMIWEEIRLAFVFTNGGGNHLYIDEAEVFPVRPSFLRSFERSIEVYPNPAQDNFAVTLDMPQKDDIVVSLVDLSGRIIAQFREPNGLNQTYRFQVADLAGLYILRVAGENFENSRRVMIRK